MTARKDTKRETPRTPNRPRPTRGGLTVGMAMLIAAVLAFALYANTLGHDYTIDDPMFTTGNRFVQGGVGMLPSVFTKGSMFGYDGTVIGPYRPMMLMTYLLEVAVFGAKASVHHLFNVLWFALLVAMLVRFIDRLFEGRAPWLALVVGALYAAHPVHTEVVASIKSRDEILAALFGVLALTDLLKVGRRDHWPSMSTSAVWFVLAMLSKENAITLFAVAPLLLFVFTPVTRRTLGFASTGWIGAVLFYLGVRGGVQGTIMSNDQIVLANNGLVAAHTLGERLATAFTMLDRYLGLLVFPRTLSWDYSWPQIPIVGPGSPAALLAIGVHVALLAVGGVLAWRRHVAGFAILFYLVSMAVTANVFFLLAATMGERFLFTPSIGFCLLLGWLLWRGLGPGRAEGASATPMIAVAAVLVLLGGARTVTRNLDWKDNDAIFASGLVTAPHSARTHGSVGTLHVARAKASSDPAVVEREFRAALVEYDAMRALDPTNPDAWFNCGSVTLALRDTTTAMADLHRCIALRPDYPTALNDIGLVYFYRAKADSAADYFERAYRRDSLYVDAIANHGAALLVKGEFAHALAVLDHALALEPGRPSATSNRLKAIEALKATGQPVPESSLAPPTRMPGFAPGR